MTERDKPTECMWCARGYPVLLLDDHGVLAVTGTPGTPCHADGEFFWPCDGNEFAIHKKRGKGAWRVSG